MNFKSRSGKRIASVIAVAAAFLIIGGSGSSFTAYATSISSGTTSTQVTELQVRLKELGYFNANCTGYYGNITKTAVSNFQKDNGLAATGEVDDATYDAIFAKSIGKGTVTASYLNARSGPGTQYAVVGGFSKGTVLNLLEKKNSWYKVQVTSSVIGWVSSDYVKLNGTSSNTSSNTNNSGSSSSGNSSGSSSGSSSSSSSSGSSSVSNVNKIVITASSLNARTAPNTSAAILGVVRKNEVYDCQSAGNGWYKITIPSGKTAYVSGDYVKKFTQYPIVGGGSYLWPTQTSSRITSYFGPRNGSNHYGVDIAAASGSQIIAVASGKVVVNAYEENGYGYYLVIENNDGVRAYYGHMLQASYLKVGASVTKGQTIGMVGSTGRSTGPHLHLEFRVNGVKTDPLKYYPNIK